MAKTFDPELARIELQMLKNAPVHRDSDGCQECRWEQQRIARLEAQLSDWGTNGVQSPQKSTA